MPPTCDGFAGFPKFSENRWPPARVYRTCQPLDIQNINVFDPANRLFGASITPKPAQLRPNGQEIRRLRSSSCCHSCVNSSNAKLANEQGFPFVPLNRSSRSNRKVDPIDGPAFVMHSRWAHGYATAARRNSDPVSHRLHVPDGSHRLHYGSRVSRILQAAVRRSGGPLCVAGRRLLDLLLLFVQVRPVHALRRIDVLR